MEESWSEIQNIYVAQGVKTLALGNILVLLGYKLADHSIIAKHFILSLAQFGHNFKIFSSYVHHAGCLLYVKGAFLVFGWSATLYPVSGICKCRKGRACHYSTFFAFLTDLIAQLPPVSRDSRNSVYIWPNIIMTLICTHVELQIIHIGLK